MRNQICDLVGIIRVIPCTNFQTGPQLFIFRVIRIIIQYARIAATFYVIAVVAHRIAAITECSPIRSIKVSVVDHHIVGNRGLLCIYCVDDGFAINIDYIAQADIFSTICASNMVL